MAQTPSVVYSPNSTSHTSDQEEALSLADGAGGAMTRAGCVGTVEQCRYYGHDALLRIRPDEASGVTDTLLARVHGEQALPVGTPVTVAAHGPVTPLACLREE